MVELTEAEYMQLTRKQRGSPFWTVFAVLLMLILVLLTLDHFGKLPQGLVEQIAGPPQVQFSTPQAGLGGAPRLPTPPPRFTPFYGAPGGGGEEDQEATPTTVPTLTIPAAPTATAGFWDATEVAAFSATATAFIVEVPTAPPEFVDYTKEQCADPELVAQSKLLQAWCPKGG